jgi:hypothetical protein
MTEPHFNQTLRTLVSKTTGGITIPVAFLKSLLADMSDDVLNKLVTPDVKDEFQKLWESKPTPETQSKLDLKQPKTVASFLAEENESYEGFKTCERFYEWLTTGKYTIDDIRMAIDNYDKVHWQDMREHTNYHHKDCIYCLIWYLKDYDLNLGASFIDAYEYEQLNPVPSQHPHEDSTDYH